MVKKIDDNEDQDWEFEGGYEDDDDYDDDEDWEEEDEAGIDFYN